MKAYIICFVIVPLFTYIAEKNFNKKNTKNGIIFSVIAILIPTFFAAIRDINVGRDIGVYVKPILEIANSFSFNEYMLSYKVMKLEKGYSVFVYLISLFTTNVHVLMFFIQLIPCTLVYLFSYYNKKDIRMWFVMLVYLLTWYLRSYTIMRQSIAVGLIMISIITLERKKYLKTLLLFIIAVLFHTSAIFSVGIYVIMFISNSKRFSRKNKIIIYCFILVILGILVSTYQNILYFFTYNINLLPTKFYEYLNSEYASDRISISIVETVFRIIWVVLGGLRLVIKNNETSKDEYVKYYLFLIIEMFLYVISFKVGNAVRIGYYYVYPGMLYVIPSLLKIFKRDKVNQSIACVSYILILFLFWFYKYPIQKNCETFPYRTSVVRLFNE